MQMNTTSRETSLTKFIRTCKWFSGITAVVTMFFFLSTFYFVPCAHAVDLAMEADKAKKQYHPQGRTDEEKLANTLQAIKEHVAERKAQVKQRVEAESGLLQDFLNLFGLSKLSAEDLDHLKSMTEQAEQLHKKSLQGFEQIEQDLIAKDLPQEILQRHYDTVEKYQAEYQRFQQRLQEAQDAQSLQDQDSALEDLDEFMNKQKFKRSQQPFDPDNLPFGAPDPKKTRKPVTDNQELNQVLGFADGPNLLDKIGDALVRPAYADPGDAPTAEHLAETIDVQITPEIRQVAVELNNNPVEIYNWVRNNIDFLPTYGSIQGSQATLDSKKGNAFDTSSLLIALLRAANIPAKYVYGTVRIPADKVMNWVGGVEVPDAAQSILGQGGIPNIALVEGGIVTHIDLEHIWVEAWVDFEPSRGANNVSGDNWVPIDASFKQYDITEGLDIQGQVPFDIQSFSETLSNSTIVDESAGSVQNIDQQFIEDQLVQYQQQVEAYVDTQVPADATVGDVIGDKIIQEVAPSILAAGLPYQPLAAGKRFSEIPANLRHKYRLTLQNDWGEAVFSRTVDLPTIAGSTLALSFGPATANDEQIMQNLIPDNITDISQIPNFFPGYLINLKAGFVIDNLEQGTGGTFRMGDEIILNQALYSPQSNWESADSTIVAGQYHAIGISGAGISASQIERLRADAENLQTILEDCHDNQNCEQVNQLDRHQLFGNMMQGGVLGWFAATQAQNRVMAKKSNIIYQPLPSFGKFSTSTKVYYSWGIPRRISFSGVVMDIDFNKVLVEAIDADAQNRISFLRSSGVQGSSQEHQIPEAIFSTTQYPAQGISAVKALGIAASQGQRIFILSQSNIDQLSNINIDTETRSEIYRALAAGKQVTVHESPINEFGWTGTGYIVFDPDTGSGAYMISGGFNGGTLLSDHPVLTIIGIILGGIVAGFLVTFLIAGIILLIANWLLVCVVILNFWAIFSATLVGLFLVLLFLCWDATPPDLPDSNTLICAIVALVLQRLINIFARR